MPNQLNQNPSKTTTQPSQIQNQIDQAVSHLDQSDSGNSSKSTHPPSQKTKKTPTTSQINQPNTSTNASSPSYFNSPTPPIVNPTPNLTDQELKQIQEKPIISSASKHTKKQSSQYVLYAGTVFLVLCIIGGVIVLIMLLI